MRLPPPPRWPWAWPRHGGALDQLLLAALCPDSVRARRTFQGLLHKGQAIEGCSGREHRLLALAAERHGQMLQGHPMEPRLLGLRRHRWVRQRLRQAVLDRSLARLLAAGLRVMPLERGDRLELLLPTAEQEPALRLLLQHGWRSWSGEAPAALVARGGPRRAWPLQHEQGTAVLLTRWVYGGWRPDPRLQDDLWHQAEAAGGEGDELWRPAAADGLALAFSGHHPDRWCEGLIDAVRLLADGVPAPQRAAAILRHSGDGLRARVGLAYLQHRMGLALPGPLQELVHDPALAPWRPLPLARELAGSLQRRLGSDPYRRPLWRRASS